MLAVDDPEFAIPELIPIGGNALDVFRCWHYAKSLLVRLVRLLQQIVDHVHHATLIIQTHRPILGSLMS